MLRVLFVSMLLLLVSSCSQWWQVRPHADFVQAEIEPGDKLRITNKDGVRAEMVVVALDRENIVGKEQSFALNEIDRLEKFGKSPPANPCSPELPLGCSLPKAAILLGDSKDQYKTFFYLSCEQHDYCYRHGAITYAQDQASCDRRFLEDMRAQCHPGGLVHVLLQSEPDYAECNAVALTFYQAVHKFGATRFRAANSTYCEYDGPP